MTDYSLQDIAAATGNGGGRYDDGFGGGNGALWFLFLVVLLGGFGNRGFGGGAGAGGVGGNELFPWVNQTDAINSGFRFQGLESAVQGVSQGVQALAAQFCNGCADMQIALCNGFNGVNANVSAGFAGVEANANARQMASMQTQFGMQTAMMQGFNGTQAQTAQLASDIGLGMANQTATILAEHCSDRAALSDGVRDLLVAGTANTQRIVDNDNANYRQLYDWLCTKELRDEQRENEQLRQRINSLELAASQGAQTAQLLADNARQTAALEQYLNPAPIPAYSVPNPNCCNQGFGGCAA